MQADAHHLRAAGLAFGVERVERVLQIGEELVAAVEALGRGEAHVIGVERIRDDQLLLAIMLVPVGQVVRIGVGNVVETASFRHEIDRVDGTAAGIPATRPLAGHERVQADGLGDGRALVVRRHVLVLDPFEAVRGDFPTGFDHRRDLGGRALQGGGDAIDRDRHVLFRQQPVQAPEAGARAVFVDGFHVPVALAWPLRGADDFRQEGFRCRVAMQHAVLAAFLVVQDELYGDARFARPLCGRRGLSVSVHVTAVSHGTLLQTFFDDECLTQESSAPFPRKI